MWILLVVQSHQQQIVTSSAVKFPRCLLEFVHVDHWLLVNRIELQAESIFGDGYPVGNLQLTYFYDDAEPAESFFPPVSCKQVDRNRDAPSSFDA